jgi:hypothetical protein
MQTTRKYSIDLGRLLGTGVVLAALVLTVAGCVVEPYPEHSYRSYPSDYSYYGETYPDQTTVIVHDNDDDRRSYDNRDHGDYDNHWDYGRRGNGNFHGTDADDRHDD